VVGGSVDDFGMGRQCQGKSADSSGGGSQGVGVQAVLSAFGEVADLAILRKAIHGVLFRRLIMRVIRSWGYLEHCAVFVWTTESEGAIKIAMFVEDEVAVSPAPAGDAVDGAVFPLAVVLGR